MADREIRYLFRKKETSGSTLPSNYMIGEPFVNTFEGRLFFYGTSGGTYVPISGQPNVFEVGANVDYSHVASGLTTPYVDFKTGLTNPSLMAGRTFYDQSENSLSYYPYTPNMDVELNIGQEDVVYVYNDSGNVIYKGQACHINGREISANTPTIILANASNLSTYDIAGVASHDIQNQSYGFITKLGIVDNLTITGASPGDEIYLSDVNNGEFIYSTSDLQLMSRTTKIGVVITTGITTSKILVDIENEYPHLIGVKAANIIEAGLLSTGVAEFGGLSANTFDNSKFDVGVVKGFVTDNILDPINPTLQYVNYTGSTGDSPSGVTLTYLATHPVTYIGITGNTTNDIVQSTTPFTAQQYRDIIKLGVIVHSNNTSVITTNIQPFINNVPIAQLYDLVMNLGKFNVNLGVGSNGNVYSANGTNLNIDKTSGKVFSTGSNFLIDPKNPHVKDTFSGTSITFRYRLQNSTEYSNTTNIDPDNYDDNGVLTVVPTNKYTVQRIALFESNLTRIQYGQRLYDTMDEAWANIPFTSFNVEPNIAENGLIRAFLIVKQGTTDLTNTEHAKFVQANRWGCVKDTNIGDTHYNDIVNLKSTGLIEFGGLSKNATSGYTFDVGTVKGWVVDNTTNASSPTLKYINYDGDSGLTLTYLTGYPVTYIGITGNTSSDIIQSIIPFTTSQLRDIVRLGVVVHSNHTPPNDIVTTNNQPVLDLSPVSQVYDIIGGLGRFNVPNGVPGNIYSFNGANLKLNKTYGKIFSLGSNYLIDKKNPHIRTTSSGSSITFRYRLQNSTEYSDTTDVDPNNYDLNGVLTSVPQNKFTVQRISLFESGISRLQYGQNLYDSIDDAEASIPTEPFVVESNIAGNGVTRAFIIVKQGTTELNDTKLAKIVIAGRWGLANETVPGNVHRTQILNSLSTGLRNGGVITTASTTTFNVFSGTGIIVDNYTNPNSPTYQEIVWSDITGQTLTYLSGEIATHVFINSAGTITQKPFSTYPTQKEKRDMIFIGTIAHSSLSAITNIYQSTISFISPVSQLEDFTSAIGPFSITGNFVSGLTGTLQLYKTAGQAFMFGSNFQTEPYNPSKLITPLISGTSTPQYPIVYAKGSSIIGVAGYVVDTTNYNPGGGASIVAASNNKFVTHRIWHLPINNLLVFQYGQYEYLQMPDAVEGIASENFVVAPSLDSMAYLLAVLIAKKGSTDLTNTNECLFIPQSKFAGAGGGGSVSVTTLQMAYDNSSQPEIVTNSTLDGVQFRGGTGNDNDKNIIIENNTGSETAWIKADGSASFSSVTATTISAGTIYSGSTNLYDIMSSFSTPPGGASGNIQYNAGGVFSGDTGFTYSSGIVMANSISATSISVVELSGTTERVVTVSGGTLEAEYEITEIGEILSAYTGDMGCQNLTVSGNTSLQTVSATTYFSGSTDLYDIFESSPTIPGGSNTYVQYNSNGTFSGSSNFIWNYTGNSLELGGAIAGTKGFLTIKAKDASDAVIKVRNSADNTDVFILSGSGNATLGQLTTTGQKTFTVGCYNNPRIVLGTGYSTDTGIFSLTRRYFGTVGRFNDNTLLLYHNFFSDGNVVPYKMHFVNPSSYYGSNIPADGYNVGFMWFKDSATSANTQMKLSPDNALSLYSSTNLPIETGFTDSFQLYSRDIVAGNAAPHFVTEAGNRIRLYTESAVTTVQGIADALTNIGLLTSSTVVEKYTTGATVNGNNIFFDRNDSLSAYSLNLSSTTIYNDVEEIKNIINVSDDWGGFTNNENISVTYDSSTRKISLAGTFQMYYRGELILDYSTGGTWTSDAHTSGQTSNVYLFYNGSGFQWSNSLWNFYDVQIAVVYHDYSGYKFAQREVHGLMDWESHQSAHFAIGTYKRSGGDFSGWIANSTVAAERRPDISSTRIADEDLISNLASLTSETYTRLHLSGANAIAVFTTGSTDVVELSTNQPYYNQYTGGVWQKTLMTNNDYQAIFVLAIPTADDDNSKQYRYLWVQGQSESSTLATVQGLTTDSVNLGTFSTTAPEFVFIAKIIIRYTAGNWSITSIQSLTGSRFNQVASPSGNYLSSVNTDSSLTGDGTSTNPLSVASNQTLSTLSAVTISANTLYIDTQSAYNAITITKNGTGSYSLYNYGNQEQVAIGFTAGASSPGATQSVMIGSAAGRASDAAAETVCIGYYAGFTSPYAYEDVLIGAFAGAYASYIQYSNFIGYLAGNGAYNTYFSNFIGYKAGYLLTSTTHNTLIGRNVGAYYAGNKIGNNNIIIGTNISLPNAAQDSINLGGVIFATGTYSTATGNPSIIPVSDGRVGIGISSPSANLHVTGTTILNTLSATSISSTTVSASTVTTDEIISVNGVYITDSDRNKTKVGTWKFYIDGGDLKVAKLTGGTDWVVATTFTV